MQYIAVSSGIGGVYDLFSGDERLSAVPAPAAHSGSSRWRHSNPGKAPREWGAFLLPHSEN